MPVHEAPEGEQVHHPKHYNSHPSNVECIEVIRHMTFNTGSAVKYLWRAGLKVNEEGKDEKAVKIQDIEKAIWYLRDEVERLKNCE